MSMFEEGEEDDEKIPDEVQEHDTCDLMKIECRWAVLEEDWDEQGRCIYTRCGHKGGEEQCPYRKEEV